MGGRQLLSLKLNAYFMADPTNTRHCSLSLPDFLTVPLTFRHLLLIHSLFQFEMTHVVMPTRVQESTRQAFQLQEKAMAPHSSTLAWKIPRMEEPGRLQSMGSPRVGHDWATSLSLFTFLHWRRKWQPTPVLLPGKSHGQKRLVGYSPWSHKRVEHSLVTKQQSNIVFIKDLI